MLVLVYSRNDMLREIEESDIDTKNTYAISLVTPNSEYNDNLDSINFLDRLIIETHDITEPTHGFKAFGEYEAEQIFRFIKSIPPNGVLMIHCDAGMSRSVAIGRFISELDDTNAVRYITSKNDWYANIRILNLLRFVSGEFY